MSMISNMACRTLLMLCIASILSASLLAQNTSPTSGPRGFIRLMNAVAVGSGKLEFLINDKTVRETGYELGDVTGGIPRHPASYRVRIQREGVEAGETTVHLEKDRTLTIIPFAELVPEGPQKKLIWKIRILRLSQHESITEKTVTFVNLTRVPDLEVGIRQKDEAWSSLSVKRLGLERTHVQQSTGYVPIKAGSHHLQPLSVGSSGNFVVVVFEDESGGISSRNFQDFKYLSLE